MGVPGQGLPCDFGQGFAKNESYLSPLHLVGSLVLCRKSLLLMVFGSHADFTLDS